MRNKEVGARRRAFTLVSALVLVAALAVLVSGAGAASKCEEALGTATYTDNTGDGSGPNAPDISTVTVTSYDGGTTSFQISLPGVDAFSSDMIVRTYIDSDRNSATGDQDGYDYMIQTTPGQGAPVKAESTKCWDQPVSTLYSWDGSTWVAKDTDSLRSRYEDETLTVELNSEDTGNAMAFDFAVYAAANVGYSDSSAPDLSSASFDRAPDSGSYTYQPFQSSAYDDPTGDGSVTGAPDITHLAVTNWNNKLLKFSVNIPGTDEFSEDMLVRIFIDSDSDATTGDPNGYDYMIQLQRVALEGLPEGIGSALRNAKGILRVLCYQPNVTVFQWKDTNWSAVDGGSIDSWYSNGLKLALDPSVIGDPKTFNFAVYAAANVTFDSSGWPDLTQAPAFDRAPDTGSYAFPLTVSNADLTGVYRVRYHIVSSHNFRGLRRGRVITKAWSFQKRCARERCDTKAIVKGHGQYRLSRTGRMGYWAKAGTKYACAGSNNARGTEKFSMKVQKSGWVKGKWRVTKWAGTLRVASHSQRPQCGGTSSYTASLTGTLRK